MPRSRNYRAFPEYYDAEYDGAEMLQRDVPFFLQHLPARTQRVLELCAGTGRAAIPIAQAGHRVVAVDYDAEMLRIAKLKRDSVGLIHSELDFIQQDVLRLNCGEKFGRDFDWAVIFFNSFLMFTTLQQQDRLLRLVHQHLKPRGRLWVDIFNPDLTLLAHEHAEHLDPATFYVPSLDRSVHRDTEIRAGRDGQVQRITFHYRWHDQRGDAKHETLSFDLTAIFPRELQMLLERNRFRVEKLFGDYEGGEVLRHSPRLIAIARHV